MVSVDHLWPLVNFAKVGLSAVEASEDDVVFIGWMISDYVDYGTIDSMIIKTLYMNYIYI